MPTLRQESICWRLLPPMLGGLMSRSRRHNPFCGITLSETEAWWKRLSSRALRCAFRVCLARKQDPDALVLPLRHEVKGQWGPKDGKQRFDAMRFPELMRK